MADVIPAVAKLSNRVFRILGCNPSVMTLQGTNTYLLGTGTNRILIDAGDKNVPAYQKNLAKVLLSEKARIEHIIVTHWHHDHLGGVEDLYKTIAKPNVWKFEKSVDDDPEEVPGNIPMKWLYDGQVLAVDGATVKVHHTPGHTTDHVVLTMLEENILFSGDCILGEGTAVFEDLHTYMNSLKKIAELNPAVIYPGHGNIIEKPVEKINYYISHRNQREEQILKALKSNMNEELNAMELVKLIYTNTPHNLWPAAAYNVNHHLKKLAKEKKVNCSTAGGETKWKYNKKLESNL